MKCLNVSVLHFVSNKNWRERVKKEKGLNQYWVLFTQETGTAPQAPTPRTTKTVPTPPTPTDSRTATSPATTTQGSSTRGAGSYDTRKIKAKTNTGTSSSEFFVQPYLISKKNHVQSFIISTKHLSLKYEFLIFFLLWRRRKVLFLKIICVLTVDRDSLFLRILDLIL